MKLKLYKVEWVKYGAGGIDNDPMYGPSREDLYGFTFVTTTSKEKAKKHLENAGTTVIGVSIEETF